MTIGRWHWGKIALLWVVASIWEVVFWDQIRDGLWYARTISGNWPTAEAAGLLCAPLLTAAIFTWLWLSAREK